MNVVDNNCSQLASQDNDFEFDMKGFVDSLGKMGESIFKGSSCTLGHTQLYLQSKKLCKQATEACASAVLLVGSYNQVVNDAPGDLEVGFEFLKSGDEDMTIDMITQMGESCDKLAKETNNFKDQINNIQKSIQALQTTIQSTYTELQKKYEELLKKETQQNKDEISSQDNFDMQLEQIRNKIKKADEEYDDAINKLQDIELQISQSSKAQQNERYNQAPDQQGGDGFLWVDSQPPSEQSRDYEKYNKAEKNQQDVEQKNSQSSKAQQNISQKHSPNNQPRGRFCASVNLVSSQEYCQEDTGDLLPELKRWFQETFNRGQNKRFQKGLHAALKQVEEAGKYRSKCRAEESQLWHGRVQEQNAKLGQQYEAKDDPSLLMEAGPFFENALQHSKRIINVLKGFAELWKDMGEDYKNQLPKKISSELEKSKQEREEFWKSDQFLSSAKQYIQTWTMLRDMCNVMNEIRNTQQQVLSYVANQPTNVAKVWELLNREKEKINENSSKN